jgi:hypothetical protein
MSALDKLSTFRQLDTVAGFEAARTGWEDALTRTHPPVALRIEAIQPRQPGDEEYTEPPLGVITKYTARRFLVAAVILLLLFGAVGVAIDHTSSSNSSASSAGPPSSPSASAGTTPAGTTPVAPTTATGSKLDPNSPAAAQAANLAVFYFVGDYFNNMAQTGGVVALTKDADPAVLTKLESDLEADWVSSSLADPASSSTAQPVGCAYSPTGPTVRVRIDWSYQEVGQARPQDLYFTDTVPMHVVNNAWKVAGILKLPKPSASDINDSSMPAGFVACN